MDAPDLQCVFTPGSYAEGKVYVLDNYPGVTAGAWQHRPESTGWVRARSADVFEDPEINPNYLSAPMDRQVHLGGMRLLRRMLNTPELAPIWRPRRCLAARCSAMTSCWISRSGTAAPPTT
ncbi:GMC oxidoreductase [Siccirubricoccus deserti]